MPDIVKSTRPLAYRLPVSPQRKRETLLRFARALFTLTDHARAFATVFPSAKISDVAKYKNGKRLERLPDVQGYLAKMRENEGEAVAAVQDRLRAELNFLAFSRVSDVADVTADGVTVKDFSGLSDSALAAVQEVSVHESDTKHGKERHVKVKLVPKNEALRNVMDHYGLRKEPEATLVEFDVQIVNVATAHTDTQKQYSATAQDHQNRDSYTPTGNPPGRPAGAGDQGEGT